MIPIQNWRTLPLALLGAITATGYATASPENPTAEEVKFFDEQVYPILEKHCFECHGGGEKLKAEFRLTSRKGLVRGGELGLAFDEGNPAKSLILEAIAYESDHLKMPPRGKLTEKDLGTLHKWITAGATYNPEKEIHGDASEAHGHRGMVVDAEDRNWWAYRPLDNGAPPESSDAEWNKHPIDAFLRAGMDKHGLTPNKPADRRALIRRAYFDLIGLPPSPEAVEEFVNDQRPDAWERLIDDLLAMPQYGEKWGRHWLDLVRYAETNGFERDSDKPEIWHYRDYVIRAFNDDKPYDQFVREQLAGDELDTVTPDSLIATGYYRLPQWDDEPADRLQHRYDVLDDIVRVTTETFLGTTVGCARCHDHKGDPIPQSDYYSFMDFFHGVTQYNKGGTLKTVANPEVAGADLDNHEAKVAALKKEIEDFKTAATARLREAEIAVGESKQERVILASSRGNEAHEWKYTTTAPDDSWVEIAFDDSTWKTGKAGFGAGNPPNHRTRTNWNTKEIFLRTDFRLAEVPKHAYLELYHDEDVEVWINGFRALRRSGYITNYQRFTIPKRAMAALQTGKNVVAVVCRQTGGGQYIDLGIFEGQLGKPVEELLGELAEADPGFRGRIDQYQKNVAALEKLSGGAGNAIKAHIVTEPNKTPPQMHVHLRGSAHVHGDPVVPNFPKVMTPEGATPPEIPEEYQKNNTSGRRRVLAEWIANPQNPVTTRVIANRIWQHHFGRGIAPSTSDFGTLGERPTHPALLDWLAAEFVRQGWSFKKMHKRIMTSRAYQMSSAPNTGNLAKDPENTSYWRFNMRRLTAEEIRDTILAVSGNLNLKMGGAPIYPPLPPEVLATASRPNAAWGKSSPEDSARRSIYVKVKRSLQMPILIDHDMADTDNTCAVRFSTTVPTQALGMLNSRFLNDQAATFAARAKEEAGEELGTQLKWCFEKALSRPVTEEEVAECVKLFQKLRDDFSLSPDEAMQRICLVILNLNEFVYLD